MAPRRRRRGKGGGRRKGYVYEESFTFSITNGNYTTVTKGTLGGLPGRCNFRPISVIIEASGLYVPASTSLPGYYAPGAIQAWFQEGAAKSTVTGIIELGPNPRKVHLKYPRSGDWLSYDLNATTGIMGIEAVCIGPSNPNSTGYIRGTCRIKIQLSHELVAAACPTYLASDDQGQTSRLDSINSYENISMTP